MSDADVRRFLSSCIVHVSGRPPRDRAGDTRSGDMPDEIAAWCIQRAEYNLLCSDASEPVRALAVLVFCQQAAGARGRHARVDEEGWQLRRLLAALEGASQADGRRD